MKNGRFNMAHSQTHPITPSQTHQRETGRRRSRAHRQRGFTLVEMLVVITIIALIMSLVGPRPPVPREVIHYTLNDRRRLEILPGLTCIWQVSGRSLIPFSRQVEMDVEYIEKQSLWLDVQLLIRTIPAVLFPRGAY